MKTRITRRTASKMALAGLVTAQSPSTYAQDASASRPNTVQNTIIAVAIGSADKSHTIDDLSNLGDVRPYIPGLVRGLVSNGFSLGGGYKILYRERSLAELDDVNTFKAPADANKPIIFCMSTSVVVAAKAYTEVLDDPPPVVGIVSDPKREKVNRTTNICGISGRRSQTARECLESFLATATDLNYIYVLHKQDYNPSDDARQRIEKAGKDAGVKIILNPIKSSDDIDTQAATWIGRDKDQKAVRGVLVLPVDVLLGAAPKIIQRAQEKNLPVFFPITDWVKANMPSALGGYGASQDKCGELMAKPVAHIWNNWADITNRIPDPRLEFVSTIEWVTSPGTASYLGITLPDDVPKLR